MKSILLSFSIILTGATQLHAQTNNTAVQKDSVKMLPKENLSEAAKDSIKELKLQAVMTYPLIKSSKAAGVLPVPGIEEKQDPNLQYKLIFVVASIDKGRMYDINDGLNEVARTLNLHAAAGIPATHVHTVVIIFKQGLNVLMKDDVYKEKFNSSNPNIALIEELQNAGVTFITCGQSMYRTGIKKEVLLPGVKVSLSARTALSQYGTMGYIMQ
jgi:intracellular sulfur oxidation DsrE/DsrF family protein